MKAFDGCPAGVVKCRHAFGVLFPLRASLRKELGEQLLSTGLVGAAMGVFEEEELWDSLIICYRLLQKLPQAQQLVQTRLQVSQLLVCFSARSPHAAALVFKPFASQPRFALFVVFLGVRVELMSAHVGWATTAEQMKGHAFLNMTWTCPSPTPFYQEPLQPSPAWHVIQLPVL